MGKHLQLTYTYERKLYPRNCLSSRKRRPPVCDHQRLKPRPNDRNISTQHIATLLGVTCCVRLAIMLRRVAMFCDMVCVSGSNLKMVKFFTQHLLMLHDVAVVWPGSFNNVAPGHAH